MRVIKLYRKPNKPEFYEFIKTGEMGYLVAYPIDKPNRKRLAKWIDPTTINFIDWIREYV